MLAIVPAKAQAQDGAPAGLLTYECPKPRPIIPPEYVEYLRTASQAQAAGKPVPTPSQQLSDLLAKWKSDALLADFFQLCKYHAENLKLPPASRKRVVFMGDSITAIWTGAFFKGDRVNRGISGQTTMQMLGRFYADVIDLHPAVVHILAGTNDVANNTGPENLSMVENNIKAMVDIAQANHIRVILGTVPPARRFQWREGFDPAPSITALNSWLRSYAREKRITLIDYFAILDDGSSGISAADSRDGVHPTRTGYAKMEAAARAASPALR